jgi:hypothetical protein
VRDIYELIRQREADVERYEKEIERAHKELEALRVAARLLDDNADTPARSVVIATTPAMREPQAYSSNPPARPTVTPTPAPAAWATAKQFP